MYNEIEGNLITLANKGMFNVISHGCNCFCSMGAGIAPHMNEEYGCGHFPLEHIDYYGDINKLGRIDFQKLLITKDGYKHNNWVPKDKPDGSFFLTVVNSYTQYRYGKNHKDGVKNPIDYEALTLCMRKINHMFKGKHIGLPKIGAGLAGGDWERIKGIIQSELKDCDITIVILK